MFPLIMAGAALLCFLVLFFNMAATVQPLWGKVMVLILPSLILSTVAVFALKGRLNRRKTIIVTCVLSITLVIASFVYTVFLSVLTATTVTTDVTFYTAAYEQIDEEDNLLGKKIKTIKKFF